MGNVLCEEEENSWVLDLNRHSVPHPHTWGRATLEGWRWCRKTQQGLNIVAHTRKFRLVTALSFGLASIWPL